MNSLGNVYARTTQRIREGQSVIVKVIAPQSQIPQLRVRRASAFRPVGGIAIVGETASLSGLTRFSTGEACGSQTVTIGDLAAGEGQVEIATVNQQDGSSHVLGSFDFAVRPLYTGAFSLGAIRSDLTNPSFGLVASGSDSVIAVMSDDRPRVLYVLMYTPFVSGPRDIEEPTPFLSLRRLNPSVGVILNDIADNAVVGVSYDLFASIYFTAGWHAARVRRLNPSSGLSIGSKYASSTSTIPTVTSWRSDLFWGVTVDLRAAVKLLQVAMSGGGGSQAMR